jgi:SNF2 family DNA or RNA helicase
VGLLVVDEGHKFKSFGTHVRHKILDLCDRASQRILLTGTPMQNDLMELWSLLNFIMPLIFSQYD